MQRVAGHLVLAALLTAAATGVFALAFGPGSLIFPLIVTPIAYLRFLVGWPWLEPGYDQRRKRSRN